MSDSLTLRQAQDFFQRRQAMMPPEERTKFAKARWVMLSGVPCLMAGSNSLHFKACICGNDRCGGIHASPGLVH